MTVLRIVVTGGRDFSNYAKVEAALAKFGGRPVELAHGCARGADSLCDRYARGRGWEVRQFQANWRRADGSVDRGAGVKRNQQMIDEFKPDIAVAFPGGRGTADMVRRLKAANIVTVEVA
jgi:hypothetical protein